MSKHDCHGNIWTESCHIEVSSSFQFSTIPEWIPFSKAVSKHLKRRILNILPCTPHSVYCFIVLSEITCLYKEITTTTLQNIWDNLLEIAFSITNVTLVGKVKLLLKGLNLLIPKFRYHWSEEKRETQCIIHLLKWHLFHKWL